MNEPESVRQFHAGGGSWAGMRAVYYLSARSLAALVPKGGTVLDLGVGSGRGLCRFLDMRPDVRATGIDLAPAMLVEARRFLDAEGVGDRVSLVRGDVAALPEDVSGQSWDAISSVWSLHHLPDFAKLRATLRQIARLRNRDRAAVWLLDFQRLPGPGDFRSLIDNQRPVVPPVLRSDAIASEAAAFTHRELRTELAAVGLSDLDSGVAQPLPWLQAFWGRTRPNPSRPRSPSLVAADNEFGSLLRSFSRLPV